MTFWPWIALLWLDHPGRKASHSSRYSLLSRLTDPYLKWITGFFGLISILATLVQSQRIDPSVTWSTYRAWIDCIEEAIQTHVTGSHPKIWQTDLPDVLVDLSVRRPQYALTRLLDYDELSHQARTFAHTTDAILLTHFVRSPSHPFTRYIGPRRPIDETLYYLQTPFGSTVLTEMNPPPMDLHHMSFGSLVGVDRNPKLNPLNGVELSTKSLS